MVNSVSRYWCPRFFNSCQMILEYSKMIKDELVKSGSIVDEDDVITFDYIDDEDFEDESVDESEDDDSE